MPTLDEYVAAFLSHMRATPKAATVFGPAGRAVIRSNGTRTIYGPRGEPIKVVEDPLGGTQVEHGDHLHAVIRPDVVTASPKVN